MKLKPMYWILKPDESDAGEGLLRVETEEKIPLNVCIYYEVDWKSLEMGVFTDFDCVVMAQSVKVFQDEEEYKEKSENFMEAEAIVPTGMMNLTQDPDFVQTATALMSGRVKYVFDNADYEVSDDTSLLNLTCLGCTWDVMVERSNAPCGPIEEGNILSGIFQFIAGPSAEPSNLN